MFLLYYNLYTWYLLYGVNTKYGYLYNEVFTQFDLYQLRIIIFVFCREV